MKRRRSSRRTNPSRQVLALQRKVHRLQEEQRLDRLKLAVFKEIVRVSQSPGNYRGLLEKTMDLALRALNTESGTLFLLDEESGELVFEVVKGPRHTVKKLRGQRMKWDQGIVGHVVKSGKPYLTLNAKGDRKWEKKFSQALHYQTQDILCVPLRTPRNRIMGAIQVINRRSADRFTVDDVEVLFSMADQIGVVMENARLFFHLSLRMKEMREIHAMHGLLTSTLDRVEVRKAALESVVRLMQCETGSFYQIDQEKAELYFDVVLGEKGDVVKNIRLKMGEGIAGWVAQARKPVLIPDCAKDSRFNRQVDKVSQFQTRNMVCAPLIFKDEVIGVLQAINRLQGTFSQQDLLLFSDLANQVAIALKNALLFEDLKRTFHESVTALAEAIELRDPYTGGHTQRVKRYSLAIGRQMQLSARQIEELALSAILHDIGKIGVSDRILRKQGRLDEAEFQEMKKHPEFGFHMLKNVHSLAVAYDGILYHHERFDGKGYPKGLKGEKIPLFARMIAVADTFDAMTTNRPYRDGLSLDFVLKEIGECAGFQFDPAVVKAFLKAYEKGEIVLDS